MTDIKTPPPWNFGHLAAGVALSGFPYEMGRTLGQSLAPVPDWRQLISPMTAYWTHSLLRLDPFLGEFGLESLEGAVAAGLDAPSFAALQLEYLFAVQTRYHFAYRSGQGQLVHGVSLEGPSQPHLQWCHPEEGLRCVLVSEPGQLGGFQGMNEHGLSVSVALLRKPLRKIRAGRLPSLLVFQILTSATCLADVLDQFRETKPCCPLGLLATSVAEDRISYTEWDGQTLATMARPPWLMAGNQPLMRGDVAGRTPPSMERLEFLRSSLAGQNAGPSPQQLWDALNTSSELSEQISLWEPSGPRLKHSHLEQSTTQHIATHLGDVRRTPSQVCEPIRVSQICELPLLEPDRIHQQSDHKRFEVALDPVQDAFLREHRFAGQAVLPGVIMMEMATQAWRFGQPQRTNPVHLQNIEFLDRLQFPLEMPRTAQVRLSSGANGQTAELYSDFRNAKGKRLLEEKLYFRTQFPMAEGEHPKPAPIPSPGHDWFNIWYYDEGLVIYHGEVFRRLQQMQVAGDDAWGKILAPDASEVAPHRGAAGWQLPASVLDACFFICGSFTWFKFPGLVAIPHRIGELICWSVPAPEEPCLAHVRFREREEKHCHFDIMVVGEDGRPLLHLDDYCNRIVSEPPSRSKPKENPKQAKPSPVTEAKTHSTGQAP